MTEINVAWTQFNIVSDEFLWHGQLMDQACWLRPSVMDWISDYRDDGYSIELNEWRIPWIGVQGIVDRIEGVTIKFEDPAIAVLFKLTWVGK